MPKIEEKQQKEVKRNFYAKVAVVGPTGSGKSYVGKTADKESCGYINSELQPLPYKTEGFKWFAQPKTWAGFLKALQDYASNTEVKTIIIDSQTLALQRLNHECRTNYTNWDVAKNYNKQVYAYLELLKSIEKDCIIFSHDEFVKIDDGTKQKRMVVHNKEYEGKLEQHFVIVLYTGSKLVEKKPYYFLKTFEQDTSAKCPEGLFPDKEGNTLLEIPNDAKYIFESLEKYYSN
jgi:nicotinamide riboside kinase